MNSNREVWAGFIAVEGIDGAGTTTLTKNLGNHFLEKSIHCETGFEPTDGEIGRLIRRALAGKAPMSVQAIALLFAADRREHLYGPEGIRHSLDIGRLYITDRYLFSSLAYQSLDSDWDWVNSLNQSYPLPEALIYLTLPVKDAMNRLSDREEKDIYENEIFQSRVSDAYDSSIERYSRTGMNVLTLDSRRSPEDILRDSISFLGEVLTGF